MRVRFLSTYDTSGGACRGTYKLFRALADQPDLNVAPRMFVQEKFGEDPLVEGAKTFVGRTLARHRKSLDLRGLWRDYPDRQRIPFSVHRLPGSVSRKILRDRCDIVHLHWVSAGFVRIEALARIRKPLVWTFRDMWPFTGGCHYAGSCRRYRDLCGRCPILGSDRENDLSRRIFVRKQNSWRNLRIHVVAPSRWMAESARESALFKDASITIIPNGVNVETFAPHDKIDARRQLGLSEKGRVLVFGAQDALTDARKGYRYLRRALERLRTDFGPEELSLLMFGADLDFDHPFPFSAKSLGVVADDRKLALAYAAGDVFCAPSVQENMANTVLEALACGRPVAAFRIGGMPDMITHGENGWLAAPMHDEDLSRGLARLLKGGPSLESAARQTALERFDIRQIACRYAGLYNRILSDKVSV